MTKIYAGIVCALMITAAGCGTIKGFGQDVSTVGHWFVKSSDKVQEGGNK